MRVAYIGSGFAAPFLFARRRMKVEAFGCYSYGNPRKLRDASKSYPSQRFGHRPPGNCVIWTVGAAYSNRKPICWVPILLGAKGFNQAGRFLTALYDSFERLMSIQPLKPRAGHFLKTKPNDSVHLVWLQSCALILFSHLFWAVDADVS
jgi:hypothetical protein